MSAAGPSFNQAAPQNAALNRALVVAVVRGHADKVSELVKQGADIHWKGSRYKKSLLQVACIHGHLAVAKILLEAGAAPNTQDTIGRTPLYEATHADHHDITRLLLEAKADTNLCSLSSRMSPAVWPLIRGQTGIIESFLAHGLDLTAKDNEERTPLFHTVCFRSLAAMRRLLAAGASVHDVNNLNQTPLALCAQKQLVRHMLLLINAGADVDTRDYEGNTPLNRAAQYGHLRAVKLLLRKSAQTGVPNDEGVTPMQSAMARIDELKKHPNSKDYEKTLAAAQAVVEALETHKENLIIPFRSGTRRRMSVMRTLRLKPH
jgi:ankyrin repeat protein